MHYNKHVKISMFFLCLLFLFISSFKAQNDSLLKIFISKKTVDSAKIKAAIKLCMSFSSNNPDSCILISSKAIELSNTSGFKKYIPMLFKLKGVAYVNKSDYKKSLEMYFDGIKAAERENNDKEVAAIYSNIGVNFWYQKDFKTALKYHAKSLEKRLILGDPKDISKSYNNMGTVLVDLGDHHKAIECYNKALRIKDSIGDRIGIANAQNNIGIVYEKLKKYGEAKKCYEKALAIFTKEEDKRGVLVCLTNLGVIYKQEGKFDIAVDYGKRSLSIAQEIDDKEDVKNAYELLALSSYKLKNYKDAYDYLHSYTIVSDSLKNENVVEEMQELEKKYQTEKHEQEIALLGKDNKLKDFEIAHHKTNRNYLLLIIILAFVIIIIAGFAFKKINLQNRILGLNKINIEQKNNILEYQKKEIIDSINYAKRIQYSLLANEEFITENVKEQFIYFNPKDIVSGDFYWAAKAGNNFYLAVCDSTGHGVPGAFMSLLSIGFLSEAIKEKDIFEPSSIFNYVRNRLIENISKEGQKDGFDGILLCINQQTKEITYSAANNAPVIISSEVLTVLPIDKMPVGLGERKENFKTYTINYLPGDLLYLYTDGYVDQFGGEKGKKFKSKQLIEVLKTNSVLALADQKEILANTFEVWKGIHEQVDDVCIIGLRL